MSIRRNGVLILMYFVFFYNHTFVQNNLVASAPGSN